MPNQQFLASFHHQVSLSVPFLPSDPSHRELSHTICFCWCSNYLNLFTVIYLEYGKKMWEREICKGLQVNEREGERERSVWPSLCGFSEIKLDYCYHPHGAMKTGSNQLSWYCMQNGTHSLCPVHLHHLVVMCVLSDVCMDGKNMAQPESGVTFDSTEKSQIWLLQPAVFIITVRTLFDITSTQFLNPVCFRC